jgi:hypothetical protein
MLIKVQRVKKKKTTTIIFRPKFFVASIAKIIFHLSFCDEQSKGHSSHRQKRKKEICTTSLG